MVVVEDSFFEGLMSTCDTLPGLTLLGLTLLGRKRWRWRGFRARVTCYDCMLLHVCNEGLAWGVEVAPAYGCWHRAQKP